MKAKSNPACEPDFYAMPSIKARDHASTKLVRDLDGKQPIFVYPLLHAKKRPENSISQIKEHVADDNVISSPWMVSVAVDASNNVTQVIGCMVPHSPSLDLTSSTTRHQTQSVNLRLSPYSKVSSDELTSWAEPSYDESLSESSVMQLLREPILTPSASSSSLNAMPKLQGSPVVKTEPIILDDDWGSVVW